MSREAGEWHGYCLYLSASCSWEECEERKGAGKPELPPHKLDSGTNGRVPGFVSSALSALILGSQPLS